MQPGGWRAGGILRIAALAVIVLVGLWLVVAHTGPSGAAPAVADCPRDNPRVRLLTDRGHAIEAEIARTIAARACGLAFRDRLPAGHGMLFVWPQPAIRTLWMRDTRMPLAAAFLDEDGRVLEIRHMDPADPYRRHASRHAVRFALEVAPDWLHEAGLRVGDRIGLPAL